MADIDLWYFAPDFSPGQDAELRHLLDRCRHVHGITWREIDARGRDTQEAFYKEMFAPVATARRLAQRTGRTVEAYLRSTKGAIYVRGVIALMQEDQPQWYGKERHALSFLRDLEAQGRAMLQEILSSSGPYGDAERRLLDSFITSGTIAGDFERNETISLQTADSDIAATSRFIDATCRTAQGPHWVFEVEAELNYTSLGQALVYQYLYSDNYPETEVRAAIICGSAADDLALACLANRVEVFVVTDGTVLAASDKFAQVAGL